MVEESTTFEHPQVLEIRIHGVSNTPVESILAINDDPATVPPDQPLPQAVRIAGDADTGLFRAEPEVSEHHPVRAYSWGQLTAGRRAPKGARAKGDLQRGLWMVLLPFAFVNVALWTQLKMTEKDPETTATTHGVTSFLVRLMALSLTATLAMAGVGVALDQVVWQWLTFADSEAGVLGWLDFLRDDFFGQHTRPIAVGLAVPIVLVLGLWYIARRSFQYETETPFFGGQEENVDTIGMSFTGKYKAGTNPMVSRYFWSGSSQVRYLSSLHLSVGIGTASLCAMLAADHGATDGGLGAWGWGWLVVGLATLAIVYPIFGLFLRPATTREEPPAKWEQARRVNQSIALLSGALALGYLFFSPMTVEYSGGMPGYDRALFWLFLAQAAVVALVALLTFVRRWTKSVREVLPDKNWGSPAWGGVGPAVLLSFGWLLALLYTCAALYFAAHFLGVPAEGAQLLREIEMPLALKTAASMILPVLIVAAAFAVVTLVGISHRGSKLVSEVIANYSGDASQPLNRHRLVNARKVAKARAFHNFLETKLLRRIGFFLAVCQVLVVVGLAMTWTREGCLGLEECWDLDGDSGPWSWFSDPTLWLVHRIDQLPGLGAWLLYVLAFGLFLTAVSVFRGGIGRVVLGVIWDVATFWPRAGHPWAPPCYAERCVPQLVTLIGNRPDKSGALLAGHSQGSVIAVATLLQLPEAHRERVALLSFGTQLRSFYGRAFPSFFGKDQLAVFAGKNSDQRLRWTSLWRATDPIGYPVKISVRGAAGASALEVDYEGAGTGGSVKDPSNLSPPIEDFTDPAMRRHSDYARDPVFREISEELVDHLA